MSDVSHYIVEFDLSSEITLSSGYVEERVFSKGISKIGWFAGIDTPQLAAERAVQKFIDSGALLVYLRNKVERVSGPTKVRCQVSCEVSSYSGHIAIARSASVFTFGSTLAIS